MSTYLVTGGAGFIGSHLAEELATRGHTVRIADSLITGKRSNIEHLAGVDFRHGDLADLDFARDVVTGCEYVLHQAAIPSVARSVVDPVTSHRANVDATLNVMVAAREAGVQRVVFAGSSSVYGDTAVLPKRETMPVDPSCRTRCKKPSASNTCISSARFTDCLRLRLGSSTCSARGRIRHRHTPV